MLVIVQEDLSKHRQDMIEVLLVRDDMKNKVSQLEQMITVVRFIL